MVFPSLRRGLLAVVAFCLLLGQAFATWSIVVVNRVTGEICVASATCIESFNLRLNLSILAQEAGAGAAQSMVSSVAIRTLINDLLLQGVPPDEILTAVEAADPLFQSRQFGIVDLYGRAATFTGSADGAFADGVTGQIGDLVYAIQGNVLTGSPVITAAESALRNTPGDLGQKVMAAMEAAQSMGGDGRCSCDPNNPTNCGSPPPNFTKSAHVGFFLIARPGDAPFCNAWGCGQGDLYLVINKAGLAASDPDPVFEIRSKFDQWRLDLNDRPDAVHSTVFAYQNTVAAGSTTPVSFVLDLADVDGDPILHGGATISLQHDPNSAGLATLQQVTDHQDGTYTVEVLPGASAGLDLLRFIVDDGIRPVTLWPPTPLLHQVPAPAPVLAAGPVPGLGNLQAIASVFPAKDGLSAWILGSRGLGLELMQAERPNLQSPFAVTGDVGILHFPLASLQDFWISEDGLRMTLAASDPPGTTPHLYSTQRASLLEDFDQPTLLVDLDSGFGEGGPFLSQDEKEIWFHSSRNGQADIWHSSRRSIDARWTPPEKLNLLSTADEERHPVLLQNDTRLVFSRKHAQGFDVLYSAERSSDGSFFAASALPGVFANQSPNVAAIGFLPSLHGSDQVLWYLEGDGQGLRSLRGAETSENSLQVSPSEVSVTTGGSFSFQLTTTPAWAGATYTLLLGDAGGSTFLPSLGALPVIEQGFSHQIQELYQVLPELSEAVGQLDVQGNATASLQVPAGAPIPAQLLDRDLAFTFVARMGSEVWISSSTPIRITP